MFQHKFKKIGRTYSFNLNTQLNEKNNPGSYNSQNSYNDSVSYSLDQLFNSYNYSKKLSFNLSYTEPLSKYAQLQLSYNPSYTKNKADKSTEDYDINTKEYDDFNKTLSNKYDNVYQTQKGGLSYKYQKEKINISFGADAQQSTLDGQQTFPINFGLKQSFQNILPNAMFNYRLNKAKNLRVYYRSSTNVPNISQLQNVLDITNPLLIRTGNSSLKQSFEQNLNIRFGGFNPSKARNAMLFLNGTMTNNNISNANYIIIKDSLVEGYIIKSGSQLSKPINLNGAYNARAFFTYGFPFKAIKSNINFNGGISYGRSPNLVYQILNYSNNYSANGGFYIGSNISEKLDFSFSYNNNYTIVKNTAQKKSDNNYLTHSAGFKINWIFFKGIVFNSDLSYNVYTGLSQSFNQQYFLWSGYLGYKFLKNKSLEAKIFVFDILNQNRSINRTVTGSYNEDNKTNVLKRYGMFTLTYTFRNFKSGGPPKAEEQPNPFPGGMPPGMHRPRGDQQ